MVRKKLFVVSDVHGHYSYLKEALDKAGFENGNDEHLLISCGDYFDRGSENMKVLKFFERVKNAVLLRGNHEDMLLKIFETGKIDRHNKTNGTLTTIEELFGKYALDPITNEIDFSGRTGIVDRVTEFIMGTKTHFETESYVFTHGWMPVKKIGERAVIDPAWRNADEEAWRDARWTQWTKMYPICDRLENKTIVCGHMPSFYAYEIDEKRGEEDYSIYYGDGVIAVDSGSATSGRVNVLMVDDNLI